MDDKILEWNMCGFQANRKEFSLSTSCYKQSVLVLHETFQSDCTKMSLNAYTVLHKSSRLDCTSGGVGLLIHQSFLFSEIDFDTNLQAVAA